MRANQADMAVGRLYSIWDVSIAVFAVFKIQKALTIWDCNWMCEVELSEAVGWEVEND